ncbi:unnamed protein product [Closterium sp. NIES-65]|nr:unnamed protein product [Closterium sp. NIES-65]
MAAQIHNSDDEMTLVDKDLQLDSEELHLDELPTISLAYPPSADEPPVAKKVCIKAPPPMPVPSAPSICVMAAMAPALTGSTSSAPSGASSPATAALVPPPALRRPTCPTPPRIGTALPGFTAAKAGGAATLSLRNIPHRLYSKGPPSTTSSLGYAPTLLSHESFPHSLPYSQLHLPLYGPAPRCSVYNLPLVALGPPLLLFTVSSTPALLAPPSPQVPNFC